MEQQEDSTHGGIVFDAEIKTESGLNASQLDGSFTGDPGSY